MLTSSAVGSSEYILNAVEVKTKLKSVLLLDLRKETASYQGDTHVVSFCILVHIM